VRTARRARQRRPTSREAGFYHELLQATPLCLPREAAGVESVYHCYVVRHPQRDRLREHLEKKGIGTALHYPVPLHLQKCFTSLGYQAGDFPVAERAAADCLSLPIFPELTEEQVAHVAATICEFKGW
jgi:dTDP-4-amino-4,6-dideoxygalactose transaminase